MDWTVGCSIMYVFPIVPILSLAYFRIDIVVNWYSLHIYLVVVSDQFDKIKETMILLFCPCILPLRELRWRRAGEYKGSRHRTPGQKREITSLFTSSDNHFDSFWFVQAATFKLIWREYLRTEVVVICLELDSSIFLLTSSSFRASVSV
jgi:hypothetical protein